MNLSDKERAEILKKHKAAIQEHEKKKETTKQGIQVPTPKTEVKKKK